LLSALALAEVKGRYIPSKCATMLGFIALLIYFPFCPHFLCGINTIYIEVGLVDSKQFYPLELVGIYYK
jgi:hypothetical protein